MYKIGQRVWWKGRNGREFYAVIRARHPHADLSEYYALDAVFADNCADMPDNWAHVRDLRPVQEEMSPITMEKEPDCEACGGPCLGVDDGA